MGAVQYDKWNECERKKKFGKILQAQRLIKVLKAKGEEGLHIYFCHYCSYYHVGHEMKEDENARKKHTPC